MDNGFTGEISASRLGSVFNRLLVLSTTTLPDFILFLRR